MFQSYWRFFCTITIGCILAVNIPEIRQYSTLLYQVPIVHQTVEISQEYITMLSELVNPMTVTINGTVENWRLDAKQSMYAADVNAILLEKKSPATGIGSACVQTTIDCAYILAMFYVESQYATDPSYAPSIEKHNPGNIMCWDNAGVRFICQYDSWGSGIQEHAALLAYYRDKNHIETIDDAIRKWAPSNENNTEHYITTVKNLARVFRTLHKTTAEKPSATIQLKDPSKGVDTNRALFATIDSIPQYECAGLHAGARDYCAQAGTALYAPYTGIYETKGYYADPMMQGEYIMYHTPDGYQMYFGHLEDIPNFTDGQIIDQGTYIGKLRNFFNPAMNQYVPHTHWQVRKPDGSLFDPLLYQELRK